MAKHVTHLLHLIIMIPHANASLYQRLHVYSLWSYQLCKKEIISFIIISKEIMMVLAATGSILNTNTFHYPQ